MKYQWNGVFLDEERKSILKSMGATFKYDEMCCAYVVQFKSLKDLEAFYNEYEEFQAEGVFTTDLIDGDYIQEI